MFKKKEQANPSHVETIHIAPPPECDVSKPLKSRLYRVTMLTTNRNELDFYLMSDMGAERIMDYYSDSGFTNVSVLLLNCETLNNER